MRTAGWLAAAADAVDRAEPFVRAASERVYVAARWCAPPRPRGFGWPPTGGRGSFWPALRGSLARRGPVEPSFSAGRLDGGPPLEEVEAELARAFPGLDEVIEPADPTKERVYWSEVPTLTRSRRS